MDLFSLVVTVVLVTASGALAPGPLFFATISYGAASGVKSGLIFGGAHTLVEFTLVMLLASGLLTLAHEPVVRLIIGVAGGMALLVFGVLQVHSSLAPRREQTSPKPVTTRSLLLIGLAFTVLNPFFIIWWLTVGADLILISLESASLAGVGLMYVCHVWMDYVWLGAVAHLARVGMNIAGFRLYRAVVFVFGLVLICFGSAFLIDSLM